MPNNRTIPQKLHFECLGTPVRADETRSAAVCKDTAGNERVVIAARGYVVIVDPATGQCQQVPFPDGLIDYPFASMASSSGLFYVGAGRKLMVLDPFAEKFIEHSEPLPEEEVLGFAFADDRNGTVYATSYPSCHLVAYYVEESNWRHIAQLNTSQKYATSLAVDRQGWVYAGIGTELGLIAIYDPATKFVYEWPNKADQTRGAGRVHIGTDGEVYGCIVPSGAGASEWIRLFEGRMTPVSADEVASSTYKGEGYQKLHGDLSGDQTIVAYSLGDEELIIEELDGKQRHIPLSYHGNGTQLSPLFAGPDGKLYGTSNHPLHLFQYDPDKDSLVNFGSKAIERGGGGNICAYASVGSYLIGASYAGGLLHALDTSKPLNLTAGPQRNPRILTAHEEIHRPRCALAHPDGEHVLYGGFPGYGAIGGGLCIVNVPSGTVKLMKHTEVVPFQSTLCLAAMKNGDIIGGTSVETPGGANPKATEGMLYRMHWPTRQIIECWTPIPGSKEISLLLIDDHELIHALTSDSVYFVFDPTQGKLVYEQNLSAWGSIVRNGLILAKDDAGRNVIYGLLSQAIFMIDPKRYEVELLAQPPCNITSGMALIQGDIYFGSESELWQYRLEEEGINP